MTYRSQGSPCLHVSDKRLGAEHGSWACSSSSQGTTNLAKGHRTRRGGGEEWSDSEHILKGDWREFAERLDVGCVTEDKA